MWRALNYTPSQCNGRHMERPGSPHKGRNRDRLPVVEISMSFLRNKQVIGEYITESLFVGNMAHASKAIVGCHTGALLESAPIITVQ